MVKNNKVDKSDAMAYQVPAVEKAHRLLALIAEQPSALRFIDLVKLSGLHKSHVFSLIKTMQRLGWIQKVAGETFEVGETLALYGASHLFQFEIVKRFYQEVQSGELAEKLHASTVQLSILDKTNVLYLAKIEAKHSVKVPSYPGLRLPAHATAMGKVLLSQYSRETLDTLYPSGILEAVTPNTVQNIEELYIQITDFKKNGFFIEVGEAIRGFSCIAAPIKNFTGKMCAAISISTIEPYPSSFHEQAIKNIHKLAQDVGENIGM